MTSQEEIDAEEWANPANWGGWFGSYRSKRDSRTWVPKRNPDLGSTLNFARSGAWWSLLGLFTVPLAFVLLLLLLRFAR
jgi:uncharacterized membrane protein